MSTVQFVDAATGEVIDTGETISTRREARKPAVPETRERERQSFAPIIWMVVVVLAFLSGGAVGTSMEHRQTETVQHELDMRLGLR